MSRATWAATCDTELNIMVLLIAHMPLQGNTIPAGSRAGAERPRNWAKEGGRAYSEQARQGQGNWGIQNLKIGKDKHTGIHAHAIAG